MAWITLLIQVLLPLAMLVWLAFYPAAGWFAWGLQLVSIASVLLGIGLAGLWHVPPFWTPYLYSLLYLLIVATHLFRKDIPGTGFWRESKANSVIISIAALLGVFGGYLAWYAVKGRVVPDEAVVDIAPPFPEGNYLVAHGGSTPMVNVHLKTLDPAVERFRAWRGQSKALDIFRTTPLGFHKDGWQPTDPARYTTFDVPVLSPCNGEVALVVDGVRDMPVPEMNRDQMAGNHVAVDCGDFFVILAHLRQGSIVISTGDKVSTGDPLGQMGNSGNSSEPHLHVHAQRGLPKDAPLSGKPVWLTINGRFLVRNDRLSVAH